MSDEVLVQAIVVVMRGCWSFLPANSDSELAQIAAELLRRIRLKESDMALEQYVATKQDALGIPVPGNREYAEIVARSKILVRN